MDGSEPEAGLVSLNGKLYGTTNSGGQHFNGTAFSATTAGSEHVVYDFKGGSDGANPEAGLVVFKSTLYGTTAAGGAAGVGTVFWGEPIGKRARAARLQERIGGFGSAKFPGRRRRVALRNDVNGRSESVRDDFQSNAVTPAYVRGSVTIQNMLITKRTVAIPTMMARGPA